MKTRIVAALFAGMAFANLAYAEDTPPLDARSYTLSPPSYDVDKYCAGYKDGGKQCVFMEQQAYNSLKVMWDIYLPISKNRCLVVYKNPQPLWYYALDQCIGHFEPYYREEAARAAQGKFRP